MPESVVMPHTYLLRSWVGSRLGGVDPGSNAGAGMGRGPGHVWSESREQPGWNHGGGQSQAAPGRDHGTMRAGLQGRSGVTPTGYWARGMSEAVSTCFPPKNPWVGSRCQAGTRRWADSRCLRCPSPWVVSLFARSFRLRLTSRCGSRPVADCPPRGGTLSRLQHTPSLPRLSPRNDRNSPGVPEYRGTGGVGVRTARGVPRYLRRQSPWLMGAPVFRGTGVDM